MSAEESDIFTEGPVIRMKELTFFPVCAEFVKPTKLASRDTEQLKMAELSFMARRKHFDGKSSRSELESEDNTLRVQLRLCLWDTRGPQPDCLPLQLIIIVNGKLCLPPVEADGEHYNRPVDITHLVHPSDEVPNGVVLLWSLNDTRDFGMSVCLVKQLTAEKLVEQLKKKAFFPSYKTVYMIRDVMPAVREPAFALGSLRVSLLCPLGWGLVSIPCRAVSCSHIQIFDAVPFLQRNEEEETWKCPICDQEILYRNLVIDEYFFKVLCFIAREKIDCEEIDMLPDGTWFPAKYCMDSLEISEDPSFFGRGRQEIQSDTEGEVSDSSTEVETSKELLSPHPGAAISPSMDTAGASTAKQKPAQGNENQDEDVVYVHLPYSSDVWYERVRKMSEMLKMNCPPKGKKRRRRRSRTPSGELMDLYDPSPDSDQETSTTASMDSSSSSVELHTLATTVSTPTRGTWSLPS
ncbi:E3 SUMO-protein ligase PIAS3-like isoform X2 [Ornithorhynchus anatinus]|uniref:E3 SUMO-protein ligase PIAS3-like isoform X2 n=1 Tax=Ornithorhynchus anatinus TaxID=9258 RepID=UPI0010A8BAD3|nr:E3 SUMO-protein ligase PIAS3-like isoform X2 [Ornithorhynchus anatinus]